MRDEEKPRRHPNEAEKRALKAAELAIFTKQIGRRKQKGVEPNDRKFDREAEQQFKNMDPLELDRLLRDDEQDYPM